MSRHRRQQIKRFNRALRNVDPGDREFAIRHLENGNYRMLKYVEPLVRIAARRALRCVF